MQGLDNKVTDASNTAQINKKLINSIMQDKLANCMEIHGISNNAIESSRDLKLLTVEIISSFNIAIDSNEIERVTTREIKKGANDTANSRTLLMVHFKEFESKLRIMRTKRNIKDNRNIYFNAAMTSTHKYLMMSARRIVKNVGLKVFFKSSKVNVEKADKQLISIECDNDLLNLETYVNSIQIQIPQKQSNSSSK